MIRARWLMAALLCLSGALAWADQPTHRLPDMQRTMQVWFGDALNGYVASGCAPTVPSSSLTFGTFACEAYVKNTSTNELLYAGQSAAAITLANTNGAHWLGICKDHGNVSGWTRVAGTLYMHRQTANQPDDPTGCLVFAEVTVASSVISAVRPVAYRDPMGARMRVVVVSSYATGGQGTTASPWTGWETAITWQGDTTYVFPKGTYSYATWPTFTGFNNVHLVGHVEAILLHTGTGVAVDVNAAPTSITCSATNCGYAMRIENLTIRGNANTTDGLRLRGVHHSIIRNVRVDDVDTNCFNVQWNVVNMFENLRCTTNEGAMSPMPNVGILVDKHPTVANTNSSGNTFSNPIIEGLTGGTGIELLQADRNEIIGGTSESNANGILVRANATNNTVRGMFLEQNTAVDISDAGTFNTFIDITSGSNPSAGKVTVQATAVRSTYLLGQYNTANGDTDFSIASGARATILLGVAYRGVISDSGTETQRLGLYEIDTTLLDPYRIKRNTAGANAGNLRLDGNDLRYVVHGLNDLLGANGKAYIDALINTTPIPLQLNPSGGGIEVGAGGIAVKAFLEGSNLGVDVAPIATGAQVQLNVTVTGAALGDYAVCSASQNPGAASFSAIVSATNTVTITFVNNSGGSVDPGLADYRCLVFERP